VPGDVIAPPAAAREPAAVVATAADEPDLAAPEVANNEPESVQSEEVAEASTAASEEAEIAGNDNSESAPADEDVELLPSPGGDEGFEDAPPSDPAERDIPAASPSVANPMEDAPAVTEAVQGEEAEVSVEDFVAAAVPERGGSDDEVSDAVAPNPEPESKEADTAAVGEEGGGQSAPSGALTATTAVPEVLPDNAPSPPAVVDEQEQARASTSPRVRTVHIRARTPPAPRAARAKAATPKVKTAVTAEALRKKCRGNGLSTRGSKADMVASLASVSESILNV